MSDDIELRGLEDLARLSRALREAGTQGKGLRKELYAGLNRATKPVRKDLKDAIAPSLPKSGGLAAEVTKGARFSNSTKTGRDVGVRVVARGRRRRALQLATQQGLIQHPVFANASKGRSSWTWVTQTAGIRRGLLNAAFQRDKPEARREVLRAIDETAKKIHRSI